MSSTQCVYRSTHPDVVGPMEESQRASREWGQQIDAFLERFPGWTCRYSTSWGKLSFVCLHRKEDTPRDATPGPGWRKLTKGRLRGEWVPHKGTPEGKALHAELEAMTVKEFAVAPGMPKELHDPSDEEAHRFRSHGLRLIDGVVWCTWSLPAEVVEASDGGVLAGEPLNRDLWERAKLSDYYLAVEADEAARAAG